MIPRLARIDPRALLGDVACVLVMVIIGTRNHDTDTGIAGVAFVAAPFLIALIVAHLVIGGTSAAIRENTAGMGIVAATVTMGMALRNLVFDRGTALAFVIVATVFLSATMLGWRAGARRRA